MIEPKSKKESAIIIDKISEEAYKHRINKVNGFFNGSLFITTDVFSCYLFFENSVLYYKDLFHSKKKAKNYKCSNSLHTQAVDYLKINDPDWISRIKF